MIFIESRNFSDKERAEACAWIEGSGYPARTVWHTFAVGPALPGSIKLDFEQYVYDDQGKNIIDGLELRRTPFTIYTSERLGWLQRHLDRTGRSIDE